MVEVRAWQSRSETTGTGTPAASKVVAMKCRRSCRRNVVEADLVVSVGDEAFGDPIGLPRSMAGRVVGEDEPVLDRRARRFDADHARPVRFKKNETRLVEGDTVGAPILGRAENRPVGAFDQGASEPEGGVIEVDVRPAQRQQLAAAGAGDDGEVNEGVEVEIGGPDGWRSLRTCSTDGGRMSAGSTRGGEAVDAGLVQTHPHRNAWAMARCTTTWMRWTVPGAS